MHMSSGGHGVTRHKVRDLASDLYVNVDQRAVTWVNSHSARHNDLIKYHISKSRPWSVLANQCGKTLLAVKTRSGITSLSSLTLARPEAGRDRVPRPCCSLT